MSMQIEPIVDDSALMLSAHAQHPCSAPTLSTGNVTERQWSLTRCSDPGSNNALLSLCTHRVSSSLRICLACAKYTKSSTFIHVVILRIIIYT